MEDVQNLEHNTSNAQAYNAPPLKIEPQQYNLTIPELPNRFNNLNYTPKFNINAGVLPGPSPLSHISNPPPLETWSNFNQNGLVNNNPIGKIETSHQHLNNNESEISYGLPRPIVKCDTMRNTALETFDRNHYALQRPQIAQASVFGSKNNFQSYNMISEQDGRESRNGELKLELGINTFRQVVIIVYEFTKSHHIQHLNYKYLLKWPPICLEYHYCSRRL